MINRITLEEARQKAQTIVGKMTLDEKMLLIGGTRGFFTHKIDRLDIPEVFMVDASQGVNIRKEWLGDAMEPCLERSVAFPAMILLASTWDQEMAGLYAKSVGEECRAGGIGILLGPGMNIYRHAQSGRNFEYLGEDPHLVSQMIHAYVTGLQSTGVVATLKHFIANNTDHYRRKSNSILDDRALHEIYLPAFKAGIDADARAVMTAYNLLNGEWCSQNRSLLQGVLREELGFQWLVLTDWWAINDAEKTALSGQDLEMPALDVLKPIPDLIQSGKISESDLDRMVESQIATFIAAGLYDENFKQEAYLQKFGEHEAVAEKCAEQGIILLKNEGILPLKTSENILLTGRFTTSIPHGGGAAEVEGYNNVSLTEALESEFPGRITRRDNPTDEDLASAPFVVVSCGTMDHEGWDRPFELPAAEEELVKRCVGLNSNCIVVVNSGGGIRMTGWNDDAAAVLYGWYGGQSGYRALAGIISGRVNPSGKLPISIEREFEDSPGFAYLPEGEQLYTGWNSAEEKARDVYDVEYSEGIYVGYRWYEKKGIEPLYPFGHGLSYSRFELAHASVERGTEGFGDTITVHAEITNMSNIPGAAVVQLYIEAVESAVDRPVKELKAFRKVFLGGNQAEKINFNLDSASLAYWNSSTKSWQADRGVYRIHLGFSSVDIRQKLVVEHQ